MPRLRRLLGTICSPRSVIDLDRLRSHNTSTFWGHNCYLQDVWLTLTDYDRLAEYVPNLTQSKVRPSNDGKIRLWQEGAQKIVGFDFRASVEMFMDEHFGESCARPLVWLYFFQNLDQARDGILPWPRPRVREFCERDVKSFVVAWLRTFFRFFVLVFFNSKSNNVASLRPKYLVRSSSFEEIQQMMTAGLLLSGLPSVTKLCFVFPSFLSSTTGDPENRMAQRKLTFGLLDSRMFNEFDGEWRMQFNSRKVQQYQKMACFVFLF